MRLKIAITSVVLAILAGGTSAIVWYVNQKPTHLALPGLVEILLIPYLAFKRGF